MNKVIALSATCAIFTLLSLVGTVQAALIGNELIPRSDGSDGDPFVLYIIDSRPMPSAGEVDAFSIYNEVGASGNAYIFNALILRPTGAAGEYTVIFDSGPLSPGQLPDESIVSFPIAPVSVEAGDVIGHWGRGIPFSFFGGENPDWIYPFNVEPSGTFVVPPVPGGPRTYSLAANFNAVPEPSTLAMAGVALVALGVYRLRRHH